MQLRWFVLGALVLFSACSGGEGSPATPAPASTTVPSTSVTGERDTTTPATSDTASTVHPAFPIEFLDGASLETPTELLVVARDSLIDVDAGTIERIDGLPELEDAEFWAQQAGDHAVIHCSIGCQREDLFILRKGESTARPIGSGFPTQGTEGTWIKSFISDDTCTLTKVDWNGEILHPETQFECSTSLIDETQLGLVGWTERGHGPIQGVLIDPSNLAEIRQVGEIHGVIDSEILYREGDSFVLLNTETGSETRIPFPTDVGQPDYGELSPDGAYLAVSFKNPAWPGPRQRLDVWLLDTSSHQWTRLPSMPVAAFLKGTDVTWVADGRVVMYGAFDQVGVALATYTPGDSHLRILEMIHSPAASIVAWCTTPQCED